MPHSISPPASPRVAQEDRITPDAPLHAPNDSDADISGDILNGNGVEQSSNAGVKVEDIFNDDDDDDDDDDDEEFPSSGATNGGVKSSPPTAPL